MQRRLPSTAETITFGDLPTVPTAEGTGYALIPDGYQGLNWNQFYVGNAFTPGVTPSGYLNNTVSPPNIAFGDPAASISAPNGGSFTLNSFYLGAAWNDGLQVTVLGKNNGTSVDSATFTVNTNGPAVLKTLNWSGINEADFSGAGGSASWLHKRSRDEFWSSTT